MPCLATTGAGAVCALERGTRLGLPATETLRPEPALMIAHDLAAVGRRFGLVSVGYEKNSDSVNRGSNPRGASRS
jgi:hypothetical protein